jgi:hypothetical protein
VWLKGRWCVCGLKAECVCGSEVEEKPSNYQVKGQCAARFAIYASEGMTEKDETPNRPYVGEGNAAVKFFVKAFWVMVIIFRGSEK